MTTLGTVIGKGLHSARPAAGTAGSLYYETDTTTLFRDNGSTWDSVASNTGSPSGSITASGYTQSTAKLLGRSTASTGAIEEITVGSGLTLSGGSLTASGGSGATGSKPIQDKATGNGTSTNALSITLGTAPTNGNLLIACIDRDATGAISSITQTNVVWTQVATSGNGSAPVVEIWKGVVSASAGTGITINCATTTFTGAHVSEWNGITGTLDQSAVITAHAAGAMQIPWTAVLLPTQTNALVIGAGSTTSNSNKYGDADGMMSFDDMLTTGSTCGAAFAFPGKTPVRAVFRCAGSGVNNATFSSVIVSLT